MAPDIVKESTVVSPFIVDPESVKVSSEEIDDVTATSPKHGLLLTGRTPETDSVTKCTSAGGVSLTGESPNTVLAPKMVDNSKKHHVDCDMASKGHPESSHFSC